MNRLSLHWLINRVKIIFISTTNRQIITIGSAAMFLFLVVANLLSGMWSSLFVNLAAGVAIVVLTVFLVDMLRTAHMDKLYEIPRDTAINQIKNANFGLLSSLMLESKDVEFLREFYVAATQMSVSDAQALNKVMIKYAINISQSTKILEGFSKQKIINLGNALSKTVDSLEKTRQRYDYSFSDISFKNNVVELVDKADAVRQVVTALRSYNCDRAMVVTNNTFSQTAKELARSNDCVLLGRSELLRML